MRWSAAYLHASDSCRHRASLANVAALRPRVRLAERSTYFPVTTLEPFLDGASVDQALTKRRSRRNSRDPQDVWFVLRMRAGGVNTDFLAACQCQIRRAADFPVHVRLKNVFGRISCDHHGMACTLIDFEQTTLDGFRPTEDAES